MLPRGDVRATPPNRFGIERRDLSSDKTTETDLHITCLVICDHDMSADGCKVCRVLDDHDMEHHESRLVEDWQADGPRRRGYRKLAEWLNVTMLRREMDAAGLETLGEEAESKYRRLTGEDPTVAAEVRGSLRDAGVPIEDLEDDFVSYGVVRTHLKECLGAEREHTSGEWEREAIEIARDRAAEKVREAVRSLVNKGKLDAAGDVSVHVDVELEDEATHVRVPAGRAIRRGYVSRGEGP